MKRLIQLLSIAAFFSLNSFTSYGQTNAIDTYFSDYGDDERFTKVSISSKMFSLFTNINADDPDEQQVIETISKLKGLKVLVGSELSDAESLYGSAKKTTSSSYEELMTVENKDQELIFYIKESGGSISELVMLLYQESELMILSLVGDINLQELSSLSDKMDIEGFEEFKNLENK
ncbi:MAG: DUF4252 domain-containing protein [Flavobacteriales bacterium]